MQMTPDDIQKQQFHIRFRGFDVEEVDGFLEKVGENYLLLTKEKQELEDKVTELEQQVADFRDREKTFQNAILSTQKVADEIEENSRREAEKRLKETEQEIERIREEAHNEVAALEKRVDELKETRARIQKELREFLQSYLDLLEEDAPSGESDGTAAQYSASSVFEGRRQDTETKGGANSPGPDTEAAAGEEESDLYEKIDLPGDLDLPGMNAPGEKEEAGTEDDIFSGRIPDWEDGESGDDNDHPALDGKMLFNLEDPIDYESEPAVIIDDTAPEDSEAGKK